MSALQVWILIQCRKTRATVIIEGIPNTLFFKLKIQLKIFNELFQIIWNLVQLEAAYLVDLIRSKMPQSWTHVISFVLVQSLCWNIFVRQFRNIPINSKASYNNHSRWVISAPKDRTHKCTFWNSVPKINSGASKHGLVRSSQVAPSRYQAIQQSSHSGKVLFELVYIN